MAVALAVESRGVADWENISGDRFCRFEAG